MLTYDISKKENEPLYEFLYHQIKQDILKGILKADEKLPSKRTFAKQLSVSVITIENTYAQLQTEGYIYSKPKSGFFVSPLDTSNLQFSNSLAKASNQKKPFLSDTDFKEHSDANTQKVNALIADFSNNSTVSDNFPFSIWAKLSRETMLDLQDLLMEKSPSQGIFELRNAIADYLRQFRGMQVDSSQIIIGAGTEYLYSLLLQLLGLDKTYAVEDPGYSKIARIYHAHRVTTKHIPLDKNGLNTQALEDSNAQVVHISPSHHFPTGIITPIRRRLELLDWASQKKDRYIIEDEYDSEFRLSGKPIPTLQSIDTRNRVIYMNTFSKSLTHTIRISYMVLPKPLMELYKKNFSFYSCTVSNFEQYTLARFITMGYFEKHINRMRNQYRNTRNALLRYIKENSPVPIEITEEHAGLHFLLKVNATITDEELTKRALENGVAITCLSRFYANPKEAPAHIIIINYSGLKPDDVPDALDALFRCL
ncbi:MAG: PLP-dependent aminotransferase family protein [Lachnospiraceae bacterium]|nr:PLP-dependent aminotransferase family protein [Lachnospiraceae bacterium]